MSNFYITTCTFGVFPFTFPINSYSGNIIAIQPYAITISQQQNSIYNISITGNGRNLNFSIRYTTSSLQLLTDGENIQITNTTPYNEFGSLCGGTEPKILKFNIVLQNPETNISIFISRALGADYLIASVAIFRSKSQSQSS